MGDLLLLYDTKEKDLARDFKDLMEEFNIGSIIMIPLSLDRGFTLEDKERHYFDNAQGAIFFITPGSERLGSLYPSPSVVHEMGQAKQKFQQKPESVIYLVDNQCNLPAIDQKAYISFHRNNMRSILEAIIQLLKNLKEAGLFRTNPIPTQSNQQPKKIDLEAFSKKIGDIMQQVLFDMSNKLDGAISDSDLTSLLSQKYRLSVQDINFLKRDMQTFAVVIHRVTTEPYYANFWWLSEIGWAIVRLEAGNKKEQEYKNMKLLSDLLTQRKIK